MVEYLQVGKIVNTHGVKGEMRVLPLTDDPHRFDALDWVYVEKGSEMIQYDIKGVKYIKNLVIVKLSGIDTIDAAEALKDCFILVDRSNAVKLPKDTFFICDLIGCTIIDEKNVVLGQITDILKTGSNDVYVIKNESGRELLLPALKSVVRAVSLEQKRIDVTVPKGLLEDEV
jgi:16S rRNA processing protein RimM